MKLKIIILTLFLLVLEGCSSTNINTNPQNNDGTAILTEPLKDFFLELAEGKRGGYSGLHKFGKNPDIDMSSGFESIWNGGGDYTGFPNTSETMEIFSSDVNDVYGGTGAWTVTVKGLLNSSCHEMPDVTVNLTGTTPVNLGAQTYYRSNRIKVSAGNVNLGTITLRHTTTTSNIFAVMPIGYGSTMISAYTIPINHIGFLSSWYASLSGKQSGTSEVRFMQREFGGVWQVKEEFAITSTGSSYVQRNYKVPKNTIHGCADVMVMADSDINNLGVSAGFDLILEKQ